MIAASVRSEASGGHETTPRCIASRTVVPASEISASWPLRLNAVVMGAPSVVLDRRPRRRSAHPREREGALRENADRPAHVRPACPSAAWQAPAMPGATAAAAGLLLTAVAGLFVAVPAAQAPSVRETKRHAKPVRGHTRAPRRAHERKRVKRASAAGVYAATVAGT